MYSLAVSRRFQAHHYLVGGDWGGENRPHSHEYQVEVRLGGPRLDQNGYLIDIVVLDEMMDQLVARFAGQTLNELAEFAGLNPSIENLCRIWGQALAGLLPMDGLTELETRIWESDIAWASYLERL